MKKGLHIGVVSGNMFLQITKQCIFGVLSKKGLKTPVNGQTNSSQLDMLLTTCAMPACLGCVVTI